MSDKFTNLYAPPCYITHDGLMAKIDTETKNWVLSAIDKSKNYLRSNRGYKSADSCMAILCGDEMRRPPTRLSTLTVKKQRRQAREAIANASNIRPRWKTKTFKNRYADTVEIRNKLRDWWFYNQFIDRYIKGSLWYGGGAGTGYLMLWPEYSETTNQIEIKPHVLSHKNVFPHHAGQDTRISELYGITAWFEMPLPEAHEKFPEHMGILVADRNVPSFFTKTYEVVKKAFPGVARHLANDKNKNRETPDPYPVVDVFYTWVRDNTINETGYELTMGDPNAHYSYKVPSLVDRNGATNHIIELDGKLKIIGSDHPEYNNPLCRNITRRECKLWPYRRFIISTNHGVIYDGPPQWISRRPPITQFKFEPVEGEFLGISIIRDGRGLERTANNILRTVEDSIVGRLQPPIGVHDGLPDPIKNKLASNVRFLIGKVFKYNVNIISKAIVPLLPAEYFNIDARAVELVGKLHELSDYLMGTADFTAWQKLKQLPAQDTQEAMTQNLGVLATDHEREIERSILEMAEIFDDFAPQVYTTDRIISFLGKDGITEEYLDFNAASLLPKTDPDDPRSYAQRLQDHMKVFSLFSSPHSIQERASITNRMMLAQMQKMGLPISNEKIYKSWLDDGEYEATKKQWENEQLEKIKLTAQLNAELQKIQQQLTPENQVFEDIKKIIQGTNNQGRPPDNAAPARLETRNREGVPEPTVATS